MIRTHYLAAARTALALIDHDAVAKAWNEPAALTGFTVGGLATHLAQQVTSVNAALAADHTGKTLIGLYEHFDRAAWLGTDIENEYNTGIRAGGEHGAAAGPGAVRTDTHAALNALEAALPGREPDSPSGHARWPHGMVLGDFLRTRVLELVVHTDDLAVSVGVDTPEFDPGPFATATAILAHLAAARHGQAALVRALARDERAPDTISGL